MDAVRTALAVASSAEKGLTTTWHEVFGTITRPCLSQIAMEYITVHAALNTAKVLIKTSFVLRDTIVDLPN
jgi:hypothetical protein